MIQDTSLIAHQRVFQKITRSQNAVLKIIREHPEGLTSAEIGHYLGWTINRVTPRVGELRDDKSLIYDAGVRTCRKNKSAAHAYKAKSPVLPPAFPEKPVEQKKEQLF